MLIGERYPFVRANKEIVTWVWFIYRRMELRYRWEHGNVKKHKSKLVEWKAFVDIEEIKRADWKDNYLF